jgi:hypothetical protein
MPTAGLGKFTGVPRYCFQFLNGSFAGAPNVVQAHDLLLKTSFHPMKTIDLSSVGKIIGVGLNYRDHAEKISGTCADACESRLKNATAAATVRKNNLGRVPFRLFASM